MVPASNITNAALIVILNLSKDDGLAKSAPLDTFGRVLGGKK
jgi:hypothetical protein